MKSKNIILTSPTIFGIAVDINLKHLQSVEVNKYVLHIFFLLNKIGIHHLKFVLYQSNNVNKFAYH